MRFRYIATGIALATAGAIALTQDTATLVWKPTVGKSLKYTLAVTSKMDMGGQVVDVEFTADTKATVLKKDEDGNYLLEEATEKVVLMVSGQDMSSLMPQNDKSTTLMKPDGTPVKFVTTGATSDPRMAMMQSFRYTGKPMKVGETQSVVTKANHVLGTIEHEHTVKFLGMAEFDGVMCYKLEVGFKEMSGSDPMTLAGTALLDPADGQLMSLVGALKNVVFQEGVPPANATLKITRTK